MAKLMSNRWSRGVWRPRISLYEERRHGQPVIAHFLRKYPVTDGEGERLSRAIEKSWVSLFRVERVTPLGLVVPGIGLVARLLPTPHFAMLSGWGYMVQPGQVEQVLPCQHPLLPEHAPLAVDGGEDDVRGTRSRLRLMKGVPN